MEHSQNTNGHNNNPNQLKLFELSHFAVRHYILPNVVEIRFGQPLHDTLSDNVEADMLRARLFNLPTRSPDDLIA
jgi:hypothetical protein